MKKRTYDERLFIDMPFGEALERFAGVDPKEMHANIRKAKKKRPPGEEKSPDGQIGTQTTIVQLRDRRKRNNLG